MNKIILKGRLTGEPEKRYINESNSVVRFSIAVDRKKKKDGEKETDFFNIIAWNKQGEFIENFFHKGQEILITGRMEMSQYMDRDNKKVTRYEVVAEEVEFAGAKKEPEEQNFDETYVDPFTSDTDQELPF